LGVVQNLSDGEGWLSIDQIHADRRLHMLTGTAIHADRRVLMLTDAGQANNMVRRLIGGVVMGRIGAVAVCLVSAFGVAGCNPGANQASKPGTPVPIASGELISVITYPKPIQQMNEGDGFKEYLTGRVEIYDHFILISGSTGQSGGEKTVIPHGWYKNLRFK
jgi:hypothetical protein